MKKFVISIGEYDYENSEEVPICVGSDENQMKELEKQLNTWLKGEIGLKKLRLAPPIEWRMPPFARFDWITAQFSVSHYFVMHEIVDADCIFIGRIPS